MIRITQLKMPIAEETQGLETAICKRLDIQPTQMRSWKIYRRSLDAVAEGNWPMSIRWTFK